MTSVRQAQSEVASAERRRAIRALLARPLLGQREDPDVYAAVVRHRRDLAAWFVEHTGWQLVVDASGGFARLHKTDASDDDTRPASAGRQARPFDRRRYALLCCALAALDGRPGQTSLKHVSEAVTAHSRELDGVAEYDGTRMADRRALVDALKLLGALGVLTERDGDVDRYATSGTADALYDVDDRRLAQLISAPSSPSLVDGPDQLPVEVYPDTDEGQRLRARHRVMRRLLDEPVTYYDDLDERERDWLTHSLGHVHEVCDRDVGLVVERRAEGLATVDPARELTDETFPDGGSTVKHAALLLAEQLCARGRAGRPGGDTTAPAMTASEEPAAAVTDDEATTLAGELIETYAARCGWSAAYGERHDGAALLAHDGLELLRRFKLVDRTPAGWVPRPAIARFAPAPPARAAGAAQRSLLDGEPTR